MLKKQFIEGPEEGTLVRLANIGTFQQELIKIKVA
jgi:hypothetical protein